MQEQLQTLEGTEQSRSDAVARVFFRGEPTASSHNFYLAATPSPRGIPRGDGRLDACREPRELSLPPGRYFICVEETEKLDTLMDLYTRLDVEQLCLYCEPDKALALVESLELRDLSVGLLVGSPGERADTLERFRGNKTKVLLATGAERPPAASVVVNYDWPRTSEQYVRRMGQCCDPLLARAALRVSFCTKDEVRLVRALAQQHRATIKELQPADLGGAYAAAAR